MDWSFSDRRPFDMGFFWRGTVDLDMLVAGIGFETHSNNGGAFTAMVDIFDSSNTLLSSLTQSGFGGACGGCDDAPFSAFRT